MSPLTDIDEANKVLFALFSELEEKASALEEQTVLLDSQSAEIKNLREQLELLRRHIFGTRREKIDPNQLRLFDVGDAPIEDVDDEEMPASSTKRKKRGHGRAPFSPDLVRDVIELDVPEEERKCPCCDEAMHLIGVEVTERGHIIPARMVVKRYERKKYACPNGHAVKVADLPDGVVDKGKYEASVYAFVATSKYADHLPLNRLQGILKRHGAHLAKQTMWDLMVRLDELVAQPVLKQMHTELLEEDALQADETTIKVQTEGAKGTRRGIVWAWRNVRGSPVPKVLAEFRDDRSAKGPDKFLGDWSGTLLTDGYDGVNPVAERNDITRAGCWAHARRKFRDALKSNKTLATAVLRPIQRLFWIERGITARAKRDELALDELSELRLRVRDRRSRGVLKQIYDAGFALDEDVKVPAGGLLQKAVTYLINQRAPLTEHLRCGKIPIHNNDTERDLRHIVVGRNNWQIFGSERGGRVAARLYSLVMSCKLNGVNVHDYLESVLSLVSTTAASKIASLTPWGWAKARAARAAASAHDGDDAAR